MGLYNCILVKLLLLVSIHAEGDSNTTIQEMETTIPLNVYPVADPGPWTVEEREFQDDKVLALEIADEAVVRNAKYLPIYPTELDAGRLFKSWPGIRRPVNVQHLLALKKSVPVYVTNPQLPFQLVNVSVSNSQLPVQVLNDPLNVRVSNTPLPVGIINTTLAVNVTNLPLHVNVSNVPLPVGIVNQTLNVNITNLPLPVGIVNTSLPVTVNASVPLNVTILNTPLAVGIVNNTLAVNITNLPLAVNITNTLLPVGIVNETLSVTFADKPLPVGIVNTSLPVNITNLVLNTTILNVPLPVGLVNTTLNVTIMNTPLPVVLLNQTIEVNSTMLLNGLTALLNNITIDFKNITTRRYCPVDSGFGTSTTAPCRSLGSSCYCFFTTLTKNYADATSFCRTAGFDGLVSFETAAEQTAFNDLSKVLGITTGNYYTSGTDSAVEGTFVWSPSNTPFSGAQWAPGEPNNLTPDEDCVVTDLGSNALLRDTVCSSAFRFVCEAGNIQNTIG